ncbi:hypothetical protein HOLleu_00323 [Holothuria leucospilota]|uniref:Uncharacterized protein n=1 Tax=Holothuria leucospilota TaxID=206669 RepID=A0A9Q1CNU1_HOLLE|nr:hypothetical protein HOLleu_00323 [Holothuria leucospilota]
MSINEKENNKPGTASEEPTNENSPWFMNAVVGEKKLQSMMKEISQLASLSCTYTNHCIRATTCTILD